MGFPSLGTRVIRINSVGIWIMHMYIDIDVGIFTDFNLCRSL